MLWILAPLALALDPSLSEPVAGPTGLSDAAVLSGPALALLGEEALQILEPDGALIAELALGGHALLSVDTDGDGADELLVCADDGVWSLPWSGALGEPTLLVSAPCEAIATHTLGGIPGLATASDGLWSWGLDGTDGEDLGLSLDGFPLLASGGDLLAVAELGEEGITVLSDGEPEALDSVGGVGWLTRWRDQWRWSLTDAARLRSESGAISLSEVAGAFVWVDLDGDGAEELIVSYPALSQAGVFPGDDPFELLVDLDGAPGAVRAGDLDGDGDAEVVLLLPDAGAVQILGATVDAPDPDDADEDGFSASEGDCDDDDGDVYPGAQERCDDQDQDCDGDVIDGLPFGDTLDIDLWDWEQGIRTSSPVDEGAVLEIYVELDGCELDLAWSVDDPDLLACTELDAVTQFCTARDDGEITVEVAALAGDGEALAEGELHLVVENVAPEITDYDLGGEDGAQPTLELMVGDDWTGWVAVDEPGADALSFSLAGAPPGLSVSAGGDLSYEPTEDELGAWATVLTVTDDDGASDALAFVVEVNQTYEDESDYELRDDGCASAEEEPDASGGCCGGGAFLMMMVPLGALLRRRR